MTCARCNLSCCICDVIGDRTTIWDYAIIGLCVGVYALAFALAIWPPGAP